MPSLFDEPIDRRLTDSSKWRHFDPDVLSLWTADMDFRIAEPIIEALRARIDHGVFGYSIEPPELRELIVARLHHLYGWRVSPEDIVFQSGVVTGFQKVCAVCAGPGEGIVIQTPVYPPIVGAAAHNMSVHQESALVQRPDGSYEIDVDRFEASFTSETRVFILCNPHNPVGRAFTRAELEQMADICLHRDVVICSDEIHCDLLFPGVHHIPIASLSADVAARTVTLMAPSKTYNIPGLHCSFSIVQNPALRAKIARPGSATFADVNLLGLVAAQAAYRDGDQWLGEVLRYLDSNRKVVVDYIRREMPQLAVCAPEATYLAWIDCRTSAIPGNPYQFFLDHARVGLSDGAAFGTGGAGFVRLNFACPLSTLMEALTRMRDAMAAVTSTRA